jgi:arylsulfatase A-like enzyme
MLTVAIRESNTGLEEPTMTMPFAALLLGMLTSDAAFSGEKALSGSKPNIVFILADDMAYRDLGAYGQRAHQTPNLDRLANGGIRFTDAYAGANMCAPSRGSLMTGLHMGHCRIRHNRSVRGQDHLLDEDVTVAEVLKRAGYATAFVGKWGIGLPGTEGAPHAQGFDLAFGFYDQRRAHGYYPAYLMRNGKKVPLPENRGFHMQRMYVYDRTPVAKLPPGVANTYDEEGKLIPDGVKDPSKASNSQDLIHAEALQFVRRHVREGKDRPFFLYYATQIPHGPLIARDLGRYRDRPWDIKHKEWAAMIAHLDRHVGELVSCLEKNGLLENTIIFFASDNGYEPSYLDIKRYEDSPIFRYRGPWPGGKFACREGGHRVPFFVYWQGRIRPRVSRHVTAFYDFLATAADLAGVKLEHETDSITIVPELENRPNDQPRHDYLYWELGSTLGTREAQAVRMGPWHAYRDRPTKPIHLFRIETDPGCTRDLATREPGVVRRVERILATAHAPSEWYHEPGESRESLDAKRQRAKKHPLPPSRRANEE